VSFQEHCVTDRFQLIDFKIKQLYTLNKKNKILFLLKMPYFRKMNLLRKLFFPFALLYGGITFLRNYLYDKGFLKSYTFDVPVIAVGNLSVGGTGKTPQIEYLIRLLSSKYKVATLSRGYKRQSKGFVLADANANAKLLGDEPFQFFQKFKDIQVAVDANRKEGIEKLLALKTPPELILLDDAYQHRRVKADFYILLTSYGDLYSDDFMLPTGNLREISSGAARANIIIVTKCPANLTSEEQDRITAKLKVKTSQAVYFTFIDYDDCIYSANEKVAVSAIQKVDKLLLAGIAKPKPFFTYLNADQASCLTYPDHHDFTAKDILDIKSKAENKIIVTTEKDYVRLKDSLPEEQLFYLPIQSNFLSKKAQFDQTILNFVAAKSK
jgi:tetraacyldisaccharide 4'-kinase